MTTTSINDISRSSSGPTRRVPAEEFTAVASACAKLLGELGSLGQYVELITVTPWYGTHRANIFDVKATLSMKGDVAEKVEATRSFEHTVRREQPNWDLDDLKSRIVTEMKLAITQAINIRIVHLSLVSDQWRLHLPVEKVPEVASA